MTLPRIASALALALLMRAAWAAPDAAMVDAGRAIYRDGRLANGAPLEARRASGEPVTGEQAACALCHQRSGFGIAEGAVVTPPLAAPVLFAKAEGSSTGRRAPGMEFRDYAFRTRPAYDDARLARAIREGVNPDGVRLQDLMPRYALDDRSMEALVAYLHTLSAQPSPGVENGRLHIATVVTSDAPGARRDETLGVLRACAADHPEWQLHEWILEGPQARWGTQLTQQLAAQPVFAVLSGAGGRDWSPVERFCEARTVPCLFPNVDAPGTRTSGWYSFYFFRGVELEAAVMMQQIRERHAERPVRRVVQLVAPGQNVGTRGASVMRDALYDGGIRLDEDEKDPSTLGEEDVLVSWLPRDQLAALMQSQPTPPKGAMVLVSGVMAGLEEAPLNAAWKEASLLTYPYDAAGRWQQRMDRNLRPWLAQHRIEAGDLRLQGNTLAACNVLAESLLRMRGSFMRDYLVETIENYPSAMGNAPAAEAFPRFSLGPGQRFSSKGAYVVRFTSPTEKRLAPVRDEWIVP